LRVFFFTLLGNPEIAMPRKPNYRFERHEREKSRAAKKAAKAQAKNERSDARKPDEPEDDTGITPTPSED
jgi:hypothetical protein